jgi:DNA-binding MarR family transcriptional regulator
MGFSEKEYSNRILKALRQIIHATDKYSRKLRNEFRITAPQLVCLNCIYENSPISASEISNIIHLSRSTLVGIIDRLEEKGFITRIRNQADRRRVSLEITDRGREMVTVAPSPLQDKLCESLAALSQGEQDKIAESIEALVQMMGAESIKGPTIPEIDPRLIQTGTCPREILWQK